MIDIIRKHYPSVTTIAHLGNEDKYFDRDGNEVSVDISSIQEEIYAEKTRQAIQSKKDAIGRFIYSKYPQRKQEEDKSYKIYAETIIIASLRESGTTTTTDDLKVEIVGKVTEFYSQSEETAEVFVEEYANMKDDNLKEWYAKLLKMGIKLEWANQCIKEGKLAIAENREPNYIEYPF